VLIAPLVKAFIEACHTRKINIDLEARDMASRTPIHHARTPEVVDILVSFGASITAKSSK
jgi:hypothetical protein